MYNKNPAKTDLFLNVSASLTLSLLSRVNLKNNKWLFNKVKKLKYPRRRRK